MEPNKDQAADASNDVTNQGQGTPGASSPQTPTAWGTQSVEPTAATPAQASMGQPEEVKPYTVTPPPATPNPVQATSTPSIEPLPQPESYGTLPPVSTNPTVGMPVVPSATPAGKGKKPFVLAGVVALVVLLLAGGAVFGLYLPTTPNSVWKTGMNRSGKALDSLVQSATQADKLKAYDSATVKGTLAADVDGSSYSGSFNTSFDKTSMDGGIDVTLKQDGSSQTLSAKLLSQISSGNMYPDIYFQLNGLKQLGLDDFVPGVSAYDGQWIKISSDTLKSIGDSYLSGLDTTSTQQPTPSDIAEMARAASSVTKDYVFTADDSKSVLVKQSFVGKEKVDGITAYHYKVGISKEHLQAYCTAMVNAVFSTSAYKKLSSANASEISSAKADAIKDCKSAGSDIKSTDSLDLWIDGHYKLVYKIRADDDVDKGTYVEIGQLYKGGDQLSLFFNYHDNANKGDAKVTMDTNLKTNSTTAKLTYKQTGGDGPFSMNATLDVSALSDPVKITVPAHAIPLQTVLDNYGLGGLLDNPSALTGQSI